MPCKRGVRLGMSKMGLTSLPAELCVGGIAATNILVREEPDEDEEDDEQDDRDEDDDNDEDEDEGYSE